MDLQYFAPLVQFPKLCPDTPTMEVIVKYGNKEDTILNEGLFAN